MSSCRDDAVLFDRSRISAPILTLSNLVARRLQHHAPSFFSCYLSFDVYDLDLCNSGHGFVLPIFPIGGSQMNRRQSLTNFERRAHCRTKKVPASLDHMAFKPSLPMRNPASRQPVITIRPMPIHTLRELANRSTFLFLHHRQLRVGLSFRSGRAQLSQRRLIDRYL